MTKVSHTALALWAAALVLYLSGLWIEPLRDWDESTYAQVAHEMLGKDWSLRMMPTLWGQPFFDKPPMLFWLMAFAFEWLGETAFSARLPGALITSATVPLLYLLAVELMGKRDRALWAALVYLLLLPVLRHGRLAMLDGTATLGLLVFLWCLCRAPRGKVWAFSAGLGLALAGLAKGLLALPFLLIGMGLLVVQPALRRVGIWLALGLGTLPALAWFIAQRWHYGGTYTEEGLIKQGFARLYTALEGNSGSIFYYLLEITKLAWPWLLFLPAALWLVWQERAQGWARLVLIWLGGFAVLLTLMPTKLPWYVYPVYPALSLALGAVLADAKAGRLAGRGAVLMRGGVWGLAALALAGIVGALWLAMAQPILAASLLCAGLGCGAGFVLLRRGLSRGFDVLAIAAALSLWLFTISGQTVWELNEDYPVAPVAQMIRDTLRPEATLFTTRGHSRPALNYQAGRFVTPRPPEQMLTAPAGSFWLARPSEIDGHESSFAILGQAGGWLLVRKLP